MWWCVSQVQEKRAHAPIFDVVVELQRGQNDSWIIIRDVARAVDAICARKPYCVERRHRDPETNKLYIAKVEKMYNLESPEMASLSSAETA
jgi:hypothetical protein